MIRSSPGSWGWAVWNFRAFAVAIGAGGALGVVVFYKLIDFAFPAFPIPQEYGLALSTEIAVPIRSWASSAAWHGWRATGKRGVSALPVLDPATGRSLGLITRTHLLSAYEKGIAPIPETVSFRGT